MLIFYFALLFSLFSSPCNADLWAETERMSDLQQWRALCGYYTVATAYMKDSNARITVFAPVDDVFTYNPDIRALDQKETLSHIVDSQVVDLTMNKLWDKQTLIRSTINSGYTYITQFENNPGNFICTPMGHRPYPGTALSFIREHDVTVFEERQYSNRDLSQIRDILDRTPDIALVIYGSSAWNGFHTFFIPNDAAFARVIDRNRVDREVLLAHVTSTNRVLFTWPWLYDGGQHYYPSVRFSANIIEDNFKLKLVMRNITDRRTGKWDLYAVSEVYERYSQFRRGAVWAKILVPNIPTQNGVVHIVDNVLGIVSETIDMMIYRNDKTTTLMRYINTIGQIVRNYFSATGGLVTFFAPWNEAFDRIPEQIERRLLRDRIWLEQILKLHIVPAKELTSDEITNETIVNTVDNMRQLYFVKGEWPANNITYYVIGGGIKTAIMMENVAATNGIVHYIERVLGVPYQSLWNVMRNESRLQASFHMMSHLQLQYSMDPWQVLTPEQNFTFFVPVNEAWHKQAPSLVARMNDGNHWQALQYVYKRHILQGQALMYTDLRERTYVMMNDEKVVIRRRDRYEPFYHGYMSREESERLVRTQGEFLLRKTQLTRGSEVVVLSVRWDGTPHHLVVEKASNGLFYLKEFCFENISDLIRYHQQSRAEVYKTGIKLFSWVVREEWQLYHEQINLGRKLGNGEFGEVFLGTLSLGVFTNDVEVAVKTMKGKNVSGDENIIRHFLMNNRCNIFVPK
uniref:Tyrosine-protein kinase n=1 Tax=Caenorhabditis japonica TaxID=281687 RepID=A0A8R1IA93_CAEJA